jgi:hypothetical protein
MESALGMRLVQMALGLKSCLEQSALESQIEELRASIEAAANRGSVVSMRRA